MNRFRMADDDICDLCNQVDTIEHFLFYCSKYEESREHFRLALRNLDIPDLTLKIVLGLDKNYRKKKFSILNETVKYLRKTDKIQEL